MRIFTWRQRAIVLLVTLATIGLFVLAGWGIGVLLNQTRAGIFLAVLISYPFTQWVLIKAIARTHEHEKQLDELDEASE